MKKPASPLRASPLGQFLSPFRPTSIQWVAKWVVIGFAVILRLAVGLGPYSGFQAEPMHGDFEAQRHWMEITTHLPISQWYFYDLQWWGLDYPPLTAYHSWLLGKVGAVFSSQWFALDASRGLDDPNLKSYMRATVVVSELAIYVPAVVAFVRWYGKTVSATDAIDHSIAAGAILLQPCVVLIDHGHFQYNTVMLGLTLMAIVMLSSNHRLVASVLFVGALLFKQMSLYYAPAIFAYLLGQCVFPAINISRLVQIGAVVVATFVLAFAPFALSTGGLVPQLVQIGLRVFPFERGLWEDKVANFWCAANTVVKLKSRFAASELQRYSLAATVTAILPSMTIIFTYPRRHLLPWAFSSIAWAFFLFSFQVHEKSVLVPLMPVTLLLASTDPHVIAMVIWINNIAAFSLWPLLKREQLYVQYFGMVLCWNWLVGATTRPRTYLPTTWFWKLVVAGSYAAVAVLHIAEVYVPAHYYITRLPDLWVVANVGVCSASFGLFWLWTVYKLYTSR